MIDYTLNNAGRKKVSIITIINDIKIATFVSKNTKGQIICHTWLL